MKAARSYRDDLIEDLKDRREAAAYLNAAIEAGDRKAFLLALRNVLEANGGMTAISRKTKMNRVSLYRMLSKKGNPEFDSIWLLLDALGIRLEVTAKLNSRIHRKAA